MKRFLLTLFAVCVSTCSLAQSQAERDILIAIQGFYEWVLRNGEAVRELEPKIEQSPVTNKLTLNTSKLPNFIAEFMRSGYFDERFPRAVTRYYAREAARLKALSRVELAQIARDGRGPSETEDMDIYFCAQEYEYKSEYVKQLRIASARTSATDARVVIVSPMDWKTNFHLVKSGGQWRIAGYCVYQ